MLGGDGPCRLRRRGSLDGQLLLQAVRALHLLLRQTLAWLLACNTNLQLGLAYTLRPTSRAQAGKRVLIGGRPLGGVGCCRCWCWWLQNHGCGCLTSITIG